MTKIAPRLELVGSETPSVNLCESLGPCEPNQVIEIALHLRYPSQAPTPPLTGDWSSHAAGRLDRNEFAARHGATPDDVALVQQFADEHDLKVGNVNAAARLVTLIGTIASFNDAFAIELTEYESRRHVAQVRAYAGALSVPSHLAPVITAVEGLSTVSAIRRHVAQLAQPADSFLPTQIAEFYNLLYL